MDKKKMMEQLVQKAHAYGAFTGTWLYAENGTIVSKGAIGWSDPLDTIPMREECVFDLASISKQFTAAAVMLLRRRGLLDLDDKITKFFPAIPHPNVTIRHLLTHTGGLPDYKDWYTKKAMEENRILGNDAIVRFLCESGEAAVFAPGEKWEYSNTGFCLLAQIVEEVSGVPFEDFLRDNLFEPAGMHATRVYHRRKDKLTIDNLAYGMVLGFDNPDRYLLADDDPMCEEAITCDGVSGDGLVHSNILDLYTWDRVLRAGTVLTGEEQTLMYTPGRLNNGEIAQDPSDEDGCAYGFGWFVEQNPEHGLIVCHSGGWPGYNNWYRRCIDEDRVLIRLCCREERDARAYDSFCRALVAVADDKEPEPIKTIEELAIPNPDKSGWAAICGQYEFGEEPFRIDEICMEDGDLYANTLYRGMHTKRRLYPLGEHIFGIKDLWGDITFDENGLTLWGETHKKTGDQ